MRLRQSGTHYSGISSVIIRRHRVIPVIHTLRASRRYWKTINQLPLYALELLGGLMEIYGGVLHILVSKINLHGSQVMSLLN